MKPAPKKKQGKEKPLMESGTRFRTYNKEVIKKTNHCYSIIGDDISLSRKGLSKSCGRYDSFINIKSLEYNMPRNDYLLVAQCKYFTLSIEKELKKAIKSRSLKN